MKNAVIILAMCLMACTSAFAQRAGNRGQHGVNLDEIPGITAEQKEKIEKVRDSHREEMQKLFGQNRENHREATQEQREAHRKQMDGMREKVEKEIGAILSAEQMEVYKQKQQQHVNRGRGERRPGGEHSGLHQRPDSGRHGMHASHRHQRPNVHRRHRPAPQQSCPCTDTTPAAKATS